MRFVLIILGTICVSLGFIGIFLPILPTTPFLLLAAALYIRSSERLYSWLLNQRLLGPYVKNFIHKKGMPLHAKLITLAILWATMCYSIFFVVTDLWIRILLAGIATGTTIYILSFKTLRLD